MVDLTTLPPSVQKVIKQGGQTGGVGGGGSGGTVTIEEYLAAKAREQQKSEGCKTSLASSQAEDPKRKEDYFSKYRQGPIRLHRHLPPPCLFLLPFPTK